MQEHIVNIFEDCKRQLAVFCENEENISKVECAAQLLLKTFEGKGRAFSCGNGGSMSDAMHFAEELTGRFQKNRIPLAAQAISDPGHISCVGNDFGYEFIFSRYIEAHGRPGDSLLAISTSGSSQNVINAARSAQEKGMHVIALTGRSSSKLGDVASVDICVDTGGFADRVQEIHIKIIHALIELTERKLFPQNYS